MSNEKMSWNHSRLPPPPVRWHQLNFMFCFRHRVFPKYIFLRDNAYTFFIRTSKFLPILNFYPSSRLDCSFKMFLYLYCFLVKFSFSLLEKHFEARFVLNFFVFLRLDVLIKKVYNNNRDQCRLLRLIPHYFSHPRSRGGGIIWNHAHRIKGKYFGQTPLSPPPDFLFIYLFLFFEARNASVR